MQKLFSLLLFLPFFISDIQGQDFEKVVINAINVTENIYMLEGRGGNIGLCVGEDGAFMIDDQFAPLTEKILAAIAKITDQPVQYLINTHWHGDHVGGNENMANAGAVIVAHENVRKRMSTEQLLKAFSRTVPPSPPAALPVITFDADIHFHFNEEDILITHVHNAHTDGDVLVYFQQSNVLHMGDTYFAGRFPFIDLGSGGSIDGIIQAANQALFLIDSDTKIIPGHGKVSDKEDLKAYRDMLMDVRDRIAVAIKAGMELDELKASNVIKDYEEWGKNFISPERFIDIVHTSLTME